MIHLHDRAGTVRHWHRGLMHSYARAISLSVTLQVNYAPAAEEVKAAVPPVLRSVEATARAGARHEKRPEDGGTKREKGGWISLLAPWSVRGHEFVLPPAPARGAGRSPRVWSVCRAPFGAGRPDLALHQRDVVRVPRIVKPAPGARLDRRAAERGVGDLLAGSGYLGAGMSKTSLRILART